MRVAALGVTSAAGPPQREIVPGTFAALRRPVPAAWSPLRPTALPHQAPVNQ